MDIRFFHALFGLDEDMIMSVDGKLRSQPMSFGDLSEYDSSISTHLSLFHTVTVIGSLTRNIYLQKTLPFFMSDAFTLALIPGSFGLDLLLIPDYPCLSSRQDSGCLRTVNLTNDPPTYHLYLYGKRLLFADVSFRHITCHKQIKEGNQGVYLTLPGNETPLIPSIFPISAGESRTCYVYGSLNESTLSLLAVRDTKTTAAH